MIDSIHTLSLSRGERAVAHSFVAGAGRRGAAHDVRIGPDVGIRAARHRPDTVRCQRRNRAAPRRRPVRPARQAAGLARAAGQRTRQSRGLIEAAGGPRGMRRPALPKGGEKV